MADFADDARRLADQDLARALRRRQQRARTRLCTICGEPLPADQLARDPDIIACGEHSWSR